MVVLVISIRLITQAQLVEVEPVGQTEQVDLQVTRIMVVAVVPVVEVTAEVILLVLGLQDNLLGKQEEIII